MNPAPCTQLAWTALEERVGASLRRSVPPGIFLGPPGISENPDLNLIDWRPPTALAAVLELADGCGPWSSLGGWLPGAILPWERSIPLTRAVRFGEENICWDPADVVLFHRDGAGGGWTLSNRSDPVARRFDGATHALGPARPIAEVLSSLLREWT